MDLGETVGKILIFCNVPQQCHHSDFLSHFFVVVALISEQIVKKLRAHFVSLT